MARTSAWVIRPRLGSDWANASSGLPKSRCRLALLARSGRFGLRTRISTLSGLNSIAARSASSACVTRSSGEPRFSQT